MDAAEFAGQPHLFRLNCREIDMNAILVPEVRSTELNKQPSNGNPCRAGVYFSKEMGSIRSPGVPPTKTMPIWQAQRLCRQKLAMSLRRPLVHLQF